MHPPHCPAADEQTLPARGVVDVPNQDVFADTLRVVHDEEESEGEEEPVVAAPAAKKRHAAKPYHPSCCGTLLFSSLCHSI